MSQLNVTSLKHESASGDNITLSSNGNVGIGTSSPSARLHIAATMPQLSGGKGQLQVFSTDALAANVGGKISLGGVSGEGGVYDPYGFTYIAGLKENATATNFAGYLAFGTSNSGGSVIERLHIDSAGRVTMPYQPAFSASSTYGAAYQTITASAPFPFDGTRINIGGHYNTSTYRFTAPIDGLYEFQMNIFYEIGQGTSNHDSTFYVNGSQLLTTVASGTSQCASRSGTDRTTSMLTALIQLSTNDYVEVRARSTSSGGIFGPHSYFSGRLVG